jgi:hypothetical protein
MRTSLILYRRKAASSIEELNLRFAVTAISTLNPTNVTPNEAGDFSSSEVIRHPRCCTSHNNCLFFSPAAALATKILVVVVVLPLVLVVYTTFI